MTNFTAPRSTADYNTQINNNQRQAELNAKIERIEQQLETIIKMLETTKKK